MARWTMLAVVLAAVLLGACGEDKTTGAAAQTTTSPSTATSAGSTRTAAPSSTTAATGATTPDDAVREWMAKQGHAFAGACATTRPGTHVGEKCSTLYADRGQRKIYKVGMTFSEYDTWLLVEQSGVSWQVVDTAKFTHNALAPPSW